MTRAMRGVYIDLAKLISGMIRLLRLHFLRPFSSQSNCEIYARSGFRSENLRGQSRHILDRLVRIITQDKGKRIKGADGSFER